ncbi:unnamed protein product [Cunninghamella blakesleeana]
MPMFKDTVFSLNDIGFLSGTFMLGAFLGALFGGLMADISGRKPLMLFSTGIFIFGNIMQVGGDRIPVFIGGRIVTDQGELAPKNKRGQLITIYQFAITLGIGIAYWVNYGCVQIVSDTSWRLPFGLQLIPCLILAFCIPFIPESPRYLMSKNSDKDALETLAKVRGSGSLTHPDVFIEYISIKQNILFERRYKNNGSYKKLFAKGPENNRKRLLIGVLAQCFQQLVGINIILMFAPQIMRASGLNNANSTLLANSISGTINIIMTIPAFFLADRLSRRITMMAGSILCCIFLVIMTVLSHTARFQYNQNIWDQSSTSMSQNQSTAPPPRTQEQRETVAFIAMIYLYVAPTGWIYPSELYGQGVRAKALSITTAFGWLLNYAILQLAPIMLDGIHGRTFAVLGCFCAAIAIIVYKLFPETQGKSLEEIDLIFGCRMNYFDVNGHHAQTARAAIMTVENAYKNNNQLYSLTLTDTNNTSETLALAASRPTEIIVNPTITTNASRFTTY